MNIPAMAPQVPKSPSKANVDQRTSLRRTDEPATAQSREAFERALRAGRSRGKADDNSEREAQDPPSAGVAAVIGQFPQPSRHADSKAGSGTAAVEVVATGTRAAIEAALNAAGPIVTPVAGTDPDATWEASVREPNSIAVEMRATRTLQATAHETQANWTVAVSSPTVDADVLARHAPRLNERLRKHVTGTTHVRVEQDRRAGAEDDR